MRDECSKVHSALRFCSNKSSGYPKGVCVILAVTSLIMQFKAFHVKALIGFLILMCYATSNYILGNIIVELINGHNG